MRVSVILLFLFTFLVSDSLHAQKLSFIDTTNVWYVNSGFTIHGPPDITIDCKLVYRYSGQTQHGGLDYRLMTKTRSCIQSNLPWPIGPVFWDDSALVREDTLAHKVFARVFKLNGSYVQDTSEVLLYDYNMQKGDTVTIGSPSQPVQYIVDSISTIQINGIAHNVWYMGALNSQGVYRDYEVVEGAGSMYDPLYPYYPLLSIEGGEHLSCFYNKDAGVYPNNPQWYMNCSLGTHDVSTNTLSLYPNPADNLITLVSVGAFRLGDVVSISDAAGKTMFQYDLSLISKELKINIKQWPAGIYFVALSSPGKEVLFAKLVVIH